MDEKAYSQLLVELECPVCTMYMAPPIRQCVIGHSICAECRKQLTKCPLCQKGFTKAKNISLEAVATKLSYPCVNKAAGCTAKLSLNNLAKHETSCCYQNFECAQDRCLWSGQYDQIEIHWKKKADVSNPYGKNNVCRFKLKDEFYYANLIKAHNKLFWFKCNAIEGDVFWVVQYIGNKADAKNYFYEIELSRPGFPRCKTTLSDYCQKVGAGFNPFNEGCCISMSVETIKRYVGEDGMLTYNMRVFEEKPNEVVDTCGTT